MKEWEKNMMCVLLQRLLDKNLITPKIFENAREKILDACHSAMPGDRKEEVHGYTQNSC